MRHRTVFLIFLAMSVLAACSEKSTKPTLFEEMDPAVTGIDFSNDLIEHEGMDVFRYRNFYNGAGVGIGDFNNDGLPDIYFVGNQKKNRLYLNQGDFKFKDVTEQAGVGGSRPWATGVTIADVNGDGWLDIYVSNSGDPYGEDRQNELFINRQDGTFAERAEEYGLDDDGFTTHAAFFDYDHDGDLDCYVLNNSFRPVSSLPRRNIRDQRDEGGGDRLYENRNGKFVDISEQAGIYGSVIAFGLSVTLTDVNGDSWTDIYISNDFFERDYLYINQQGKGFSEELEQRTDEISLASMGADAGDLNQDGKPEIFVTEMLPEHSKRMKQVTSFETFQAFDFKKQQGFYNQFQRNTLQLNQRDGYFQEISRYAGVDATDWSWGALIFDMNNDAENDIFVSNGVYKDVTDQDFLAYFGSEENLMAARAGDEIKFDEFVDRMPSNPIPNYAFVPDTALTYQNKSGEWGLDTPSFSNGAAYGDLDNDGDLDLVVNNLNQDPFVYQNNTDSFTSNHYLKVNLKGNQQNPFAIGVSVSAFIGDRQISKEFYPSKGFQSSVDHQLVFGLGNRTRVDSLRIRWNEFQVSRYNKLPVDTLLTFSISEAQREKVRNTEKESLFRQVPFRHRHTENNFNDFTQSGLLMHKLSMEGPPVAAADLNNDGRDDFYIGGATGMPGSLFMNAGGHSFREVTVSAFTENAAHEEVDAVFFDADGDGDQDLYVVSGGSEFGSDLEKFADRLYINEGMNGNTPDFSLSDGLPSDYTSGSCVRPADYDNDGDMDLFVGGRSVPGEYGKPAESYLLENGGTGRFSDVTSKYMTQLRKIGMVTGAAWTDYDNDEDLDLIVVGDWMPITLFENRGNFFQRQFDVPGLSRTEGWWESITPADLNGDGNVDFIAGNLGTNSMFKADSAHPVKLYVNDFDRNGMLDHVYAFRQGDEYVPYHLKKPLGRQLSFIEAKFPKFEDYADKSMSEIFSKEQLDNALQLTAYQLHSVAVINHGDGTFSVKHLPKEAQYAPVFDTAIDDFDGDGGQEALLTGNFSGTRPREGFYLANHGALFEIEEDGSLRNIDYSKSGLWVRGDVRDTEILRTNTGKLLVIGKNDGQTEIYEYK